MGAIFLSASIPIKGRGSFYENSDPFLIHTAVREFVTAVLGRHLIVWGGHPSITPMIWAVCEDLGVDYSEACVLYQSRYFEEDFPEENAKFNNIYYVDAIENNLELSLLNMRIEMLSRADIDTAVFIGGMEGIFSEYDLFKEYHPDGHILTIDSPGGAASQLSYFRSNKILRSNETIPTVNFAELIYENLNINPNLERTIGVKKTSLRPK